MIIHDILTNTVLQGCVEGIRKRGRPKRSWMDYVYEMTGMSNLYLINVTKDSYIWKKLCLTSYHVPLQRLVMGLVNLLANL